MKEQQESNRGPRCTRWQANNSAHAIPDNSAETHLKSNERVSGRYARTNLGITRIGPSPVRPVSLISGDPKSSLVSSWRPSQAKPSELSHHPSLSISCIVGMVIRVSQHCIVGMFVVMLCPPLDSHCCTQRNSCKIYRIYVPQIPTKMFLRAFERFFYGLYAKMASLRYAAWRQWRRWRRLRCSSRNIRLDLLDRLSGAGSGEGALSSS